MIAETSVHNTTFLMFIVTNGWFALGKFWSNVCLFVGEKSVITPCFLLRLAFYRFAKKKEIPAKLKRTPKCVGRAGRF